MQPSVSACFIQQNENELNDQQNHKSILQSSKKEIIDTL